MRSIYTFSVVIQLRFEAPLRAKYYSTEMSHFSAMYKARVRRRHLNFTFQPAASHVEPFCRVHSQNHFSMQLFSMHYQLHNHKGKNYLMKNDAAAEVPAETPAGATKLCEVKELPAPVGSELFCPEVTWTLGPSLLLSGAVSA